MLDGEPTTANVIIRLVEAADHARDARRLAKATGSPVHQARMLKAETDVLTKLVEALGITDTSVSEYMEEAEQLMAAVKGMVHHDRQAGLALLNETYRIPELAPFARTLETLLGVRR
ncbi:hypothetical protein CSX12_06720 [Microbacterium sp. Y-01]|nr:hypothetical protein CSX12_06720 [Microbacterium sp. Y-01]